jgi:hypothetical protein
VIDPTEIYLVAVGALLLVALGAGARVLAAIYREGRDRTRRRRREEPPDGDGPATDPGPPDAEAASPGADDARSAGIACPQCGAENEPEFTYCNECAAPLGSDL